jgi:hypothetical protein
VIEIKADASDTVEADDGKQCAASGAELLAMLRATDTGGSSPSLPQLPPPAPKPVPLAEAETQGGEACQRGVLASEAKELYDFQTMPSHFLPADTESMLMSDANAVQWQQAAQLNRTMALKGAETAWSTASDSEGLAKLYGCHAAAANAAAAAAAEWQQCVGAQSNAAWVRATAGCDWLDDASTDAGCGSNESDASGEPSGVWRPAGGAAGATSPPLRPGGDPNMRWQGDAEGSKVGAGRALARGTPPAPQTTAYVSR